MTNAANAANSSRRPDAAAGPGAPAGLSAGVGLPLWMAIADALRDDIRSGRLTPGSRLVEAEIGRRFDVSQATVRGALAELVTQRYLVKQPRRGTYVAEPTVGDPARLQDIRTLLEPYAVEVLCSLDDEARLAVLERLDAALTEMRLAVEVRSEERLIVAERDFHRELWCGAGDAYLTRLWEVVDGLLQEAVGIRLLADDDPFVRTVATHTAIRKAVAAGDGEKAAALVRTRGERTKKRILAAIAAEQRPRR